ncbi:hypothetical protein ACS0TY_019530 [Phlomoides rotata]
MAQQAYTAHSGHGSIGPIIGVLTVIKYFTVKDAPFEQIWKSFAPRKAITTTWRLLHNKLPMRNNLQRRGIISMI